MTRRFFKTHSTNQTYNDGNNKGHVSVNRWHIADAVPFQRQFVAEIEKYYSNQRPTLYAAVAYWYQAAGGRDPYRPVAVTERVGYCPEVKTIKVKGAIEGERLKILAVNAMNGHETRLRPMRIPPIC